MTNIKIKSEGLSPRKQKFTTEEDHPIHGVKSAVIRMAYNKVTTAELEILSTLDLKANGMFMVYHPILGTLRKIKRIEFADGSVFEDVGQDELCEVCGAPATGSSREIVELMPKGHDMQFACVPDAHRFCEEHAPETT